MQSGGGYDDTPDWLRTDAGEDATTTTPKNTVSGTGETPAAPEHQPSWLSPTIEGVEQGTTLSPAPTEEQPAPAAARRKKQQTWGEYFCGTWKRDGRLLVITLLIIVVMQIPFVHWVLYPFTIFSTWVHEICHGMAAILVGGDIDRLELFPDGSGLAYTTTTTTGSRGFVASAGYQGTAVVGCLLLAVRRTKRGPRTGLMVLALFMILSTLLWIRRAVFGVMVTPVLGGLLAWAAVKLSSPRLRDLFVCVAVTTCLNAITSVRVLFGSSFQVNGEDHETDAHSMADLNSGTSSWMWATVWLCLALFCTAVGILFAIPGPDEVADFAYCGVCQDMGLFRLCNAPGQRWMRRLFGKGNDDSATTTTTTPASAVGATSSSAATGDDPNGTTDKTTMTKDPLAV